MNKRKIFWVVFALLVFSAGSAFAVSITIVNGDFETGNNDDAPPAGWTDNTPTSFWLGVPDETGNPTAAEAAEAPGGLGNFFLTTARQSVDPVVASQPVDGQLIQTVDLSAFATDIDAGTKTLYVDFIYASDDHRDTGAFSLHFFSSTDGSGTELGPGYSVSMDATNGDWGFTGWQEMTVGGLVPVSARSVTLQIDTTRTGGSETNIWIDNISFPKTASNPSPTGDLVDVAATLNWDPPVAYTGATYNVYFGTTEPNFLLPAPYGLSNTLATGTTATTAIPVPSPMAYNTTYYWVVDTYEPNDVPILHQGTAWSFTTIPEDNTPAVTAGSSYITWLDNLPQAIDGTVDDHGEGDVVDADVIWSISRYPGDPVPEVMQMIQRSTLDADLLELASYGEDPNVLVDWIGTDTRESGDPLVLTLTGLPAGSYTWTSTHHDVDNQTGQFSVSVDGTTVATDVDITAANEFPVSKFTTAFTTDGINPVTVVFDQTSSGGDNDEYDFFVMNGFEITDGVNTMKVDFTRTAIAPDPNLVGNGYQTYLASHEVAETFTAQDFAFGDATVTVLPEWGPNAAGLITATVTKTSTDPLNPTATFTTDYAGDYTIRLAATDMAAQSGSDTLVIRVAADACEAAKLNGASVNYYDVDENCVVDLTDLAGLTAQWLNDISLTESVAY